MSSAGGQGLGAAGAEGGVCAERWRAEPGPGLEGPGSSAKQSGQGDLITFSTLGRL